MKKYMYVLKFEYQAENYIVYVVWNLEVSSAVATEMVNFNRKKINHWDLDKKISVLILRYIHLMPAVLQVWERKPTNSYIGSHSHQGDYSQILER